MKTVKKQSYPAGATGAVQRATDFQGALGAVDDISVAGAVQRATGGWHGRNVMAYSVTLPESRELTSREIPAI